MPITNENGETKKQEELLNEETNILSDEEKKQAFGYAEDVKKAEEGKTTPLPVYPISWKKQGLITASTTAISFLPIAVKIYNQKKDPSLPGLTYADALDLLIYKIPDAMMLIERWAYGKESKAKVLFKLTWMFKHFAPAIPTILNVVKQYKKTGSVEFDSELSSHLTVFILNTAIPWFLTNKYVSYVIEKLFAGSLENFIVTYLMRSSNPLLREIGNLIPVGSMVIHRSKNIIDHMSKETKVESPTGKYGQTNNLNHPYENQNQQDYNKAQKSGFEKFVDGLANFVGSNGGNGGYATPYNSIYGYGYGNNNIWGGNNHL